MSAKTYPDEDAVLVLDHRGPVTTRMSANFERNGRTRLPPLLKKVGRRLRTSHRSALCVAAAAPDGPYRPAIRRHPLNPYRRRLATPWSRPCRHSGRWRPRPCRRRRSPPRCRSIAPARECAERLRVETGDRPRSEVDRERARPAIAVETCMPPTAASITSCTSRTVRP